MADLHISKTTDWDINRINRLTDVVKQLDIDRVYILGDLFDITNPSTKAIQLAYNMIKQFPQTFYLNGNHERISAKHYILNDLADMFDIKHLPKVFEIGDIRFVAYGHDMLHQVGDTEADVMLGHFRWTHKLYGKGELIDEHKVCRMYSYIFLGDIHDRSTYCEEKVKYVSSPYSVSYTNSTEFGGVILDVQNDRLNYEYIDFNLPQKVKIKLPFVKARRFIETVEPENLYKVKIQCTQDETSELVKWEIPQNVIMIPSVTHIEEKEEYMKPQEDVVDTLLLNLPKRLDKHKNYIQKVITEGLREVQI